MISNKLYPIQVDKRPFPFHRSLLGTENLKTPNTSKNK